MSVKSLREYAQDRGVSYEAVRKAVKRHQAELGDHITEQNRKRYIDDAGQAMLDRYRQINTVTILEGNVNEELERLKAELERRDQQIMKLQERIIEDQEQKIGLIEYKARAELLIEQKEHQEAELKAKDAELQELKAELAEERRRAQSFKRGLFGFYRKKERPNE